MGMQDRDWYRQEQKEKRQQQWRPAPAPKPVKKSRRFELTTPLFVVLAGAMLAAILWL